MQEKQYKFEIGDVVQLKGTNYRVVIIGYVDLDKPYLADNRRAYSEDALEKYIPQHFKIGQYVQRAGIEDESIYKVEKDFGDGLYYIREIYPHYSEYDKECDMDEEWKYIPYTKKYIIKDEEIIYTKRKKLNLKKYEKMKRKER